MPEIRPCAAAHIAADDVRMRRDMDGSGLGSLGLPWFRRRPRASVAVAVGLFVAVFVARIVIGSATDAVSMLFSLPIALLAVTFGLLAGLIGGAVAVALIGAWAGSSDVELSLLGWAARATPMLLLGGLVGSAADRLSAAEEERRRLLLAAHRHRDAVELNDSIVQGLAAAKWSLEAGSAERGLEVVTETLEAAQAMVSELLSDVDQVSVSTQRRRSRTPESLARRHG